MESKKYYGPLESGSYPVWLPDSSGIVFTQGLIDTFFTRYRHGGLVLADRELRQVREILSDATIRRPRVAPDGQSIYFDRWNVESDIWMLTLNKGRE